MKVSYYGNSSFLFRSKETKLVTNPLDTGVKVNLKKVAPDILVLSHDQKLEEDGYYIISSPGEYEIKDIFIYGYVTDLEKDGRQQADAYMFDVEHVHVSILDRSVKKVRGFVIDEMGIVDILLVSLSPDAGMNMSKVIDLVNRIEPYIVTPTDYTEESLTNFTKAMGIQDIEKVKTLDVKRSDFNDEESSMRFVVLEK